jgi:2-dehydro-3-deoxyphosphogluconate aldolase/(4S)-4-hydroxy-2-oxoglutarate aldolase
MTTTTTAAATLERLGQIRIIPVVTLDDPDRATEVAAALLAGGIPTAEITLRTPAGLDAIRAIANVPGFLVGAGTVLTAEQVDQCVDAGAQYLVTPGYDDHVVTRARHHGIPILPGVATATEIQYALRAGIQVVKFFPADRLGGLDTITALAAPFPGLRFIPSGGVSPTNAAHYLAHPAIFAISGSWMVPRNTITAGDYNTIRQLSLAASALAPGTA